MTNHPVPIGDIPIVISYYSLVTITVLILHYSHGDDASMQIIFEKYWKYYVHSLIPIPSRVHFVGTIILSIILLNNTHIIDAFV